ncbi:hypothetical protein KPL74_13600 [Bacillus sp. NP157]|nr:hypothetical protein KPL74_13600 [Bacillus sp. NP157]
MGLAVPLRLIKIGMSAFDPKRTLHFSFLQGVETMLSNDVAEEIARRFTDASDQCTKSLRVVMSSQSLGQVKVYGKLVGSFMGHSYTNILKPIWDAHPELMPPEMHDPYTSPKPELTPESREALEAFLAAAVSSIEFAKQHVPEDQRESLFAYGGMAEVVAAAEAIADFLAVPRFSDE